MVKIELTKEELSFLFECLKWNKYHYEEKWNTQSYGKISKLSFIKEDNINKMNDLITKLHKIKNA